MINRGGQKITPTEVDEKLLAHPEVDQAATFPVPHPTLGEDVAAAVVLKPKATLREEALSRFLLERLAAFKVPRRLLFVEDIPKGPTGKVQRHILAAAFGLADAPARRDAADSAEDRQPTPLEKTLQALWARSLGLQTIGLRENFFQAGGDSLKAVELFLEIEKRLGRRLPRAILFEAGTVSEMARYISDADEPSPCLVPIQPEGNLPPFFCVHDQDGHVLITQDSFS